uniref:Uncharacterized protein n=1 Tax=Solanum lycopersicum TaxID=4081 RepID=A0A3Q7GE75_SOLLC
MKSTIYIHLESTSMFTENLPCSQSLKSTSKVFRNSVIQPISESFRMVYPTVLPEGFFSSSSYLETGSIENNRTSSHREISSVIPGCPTFLLSIKIPTSPGVFSSQSFPSRGNFFSWYVKKRRTVSTFHAKQDCGQPGFTLAERTRFGAILKEYVNLFKLLNRKVVITS